MGHFEELAPGSAIGEHIVESLSGSGNFGVVYKARDLDGRAVAIKVSKRPASRLSSQELVFLQNEIEALSRLDHPSLVAVQSYGFLPDDRLYLVMDLIDGVRLDDYLRERGRLDVIEAIQIVRTIAGVLAHIHERNVLHLDLKPGNIMVTDPYEPRLKVLDFGLATMREIWRAEKPSFVAGTPSYMAPEILPGMETRHPSAKADLYALGTIFYELLTGERPYGDASVWQRLVAELTPLAQVVPTVPGPVASLVHALLARDPAERPGSAAELGDRLKQLYYVALRGEDEGDGEVREQGLAVRPWVSAGQRQAPFVGRRAELETLSQSFAALDQGRGGAALVVGEAGIGKSRLIAELLARREAASDCLIGYGRCRHLGKLVPYSPLREALAQIVGAIRDLQTDRGYRLRDRIAEVLAGEPGVLIDLVPELRDLVRHGAGAAGGEPAGGLSGDLAAFRLVGAERVVRAVHNLLQAVATELPVVLAIEDLHWADEGSRLVLSRLCGYLEQAPILALFTSRSAEALMNGDGRGDHAMPLRLLTLDSLANRDSTELILALLHSPEGTLATSPPATSLADTLPPDALAQPGSISQAKVLDDTLSQVSLIEELLRSVPLLRAGNPLCTTQVMYDLALGGYLARDAGGRVVLSRRIRHDYVPPDSVSMVLARILRHLAPGALEVLGVGALMGRQLRRSDMVALDLFTAAEVDAALAEAQSRALCLVDGDLCTFAHDTITAELERTVDAAALPGIHGRIARQLQRRGSAPGPLAHHLEQAGDLLPATEAYFEAGLEADRVHDPASAGKLLQKAFDLLVALSADSRRNDLLVRTAHELARIACLSGDTDHIVESLERCTAALGSPTVEQTLALDSAYARVHYVRGNFPDAVASSRACLGVQVSDPSLRAYQCAPANIVGRALSATGKFGPSIDPLAQGCALAREAGDYVELSHSEGLLGVSLGFTGAFERAREHVAGATDVAQRLEDPIRIMGAFFYQAALGESSGDWKLGVRSSTQLIYFAEKHAISGLYLYLGTMFAGRHQFHTGQLERARVLLANAIHLARTLKIRIGASWAYAFLGDVHFAGGRHDNAAETYRRGVEQGGAGAAGDEYGAPMCLMGLAHLAALDGREADARRMADEALGRLDAMSNRCVRAVSLQRHAEALEALGDGDGAARCMDERAALARTLNDRVADFWPEVPAALAEKAAPAAPAPLARAFWESLWNQADREQADSAETDTWVMAAGGNRSVLLESLSTIEGFVPIF